MTGFTRQIKESLQITQASCTNSFCPALVEGTPASDWMSCGKDIQSGYKRHPTESKLDTLTAAMLSPSARVPKLKCYAAECRAMVPIALDVARAHLNRGDPNESTILLAMTELHSCYQCLSTGQGVSLPEHSRRFASLCVALETTGVEPFGVKPKLLLFSGTGRDGRLPTSLVLDLPRRRFRWYGGTAGRRRGGPRTIAATGSQVLQRFVGRHQVPVLT